MPQIGPAEILVILLVALLVFGPKRLPEVGRQVGRGMRELRKLQETVTGEINEVLHGVENADRAEVGDVAALETEDASPASSLQAADMPLPSLPAGDAELEPRAVPSVRRAPSRFRPPHRGTTA